MSAPRPRLEIALLLALVLAVGSAFAWNALGRGGRSGGSIQDLFGSANQPGLACLKEVVEEAFAEDLLADEPVPLGSRAFDEVAGHVEQVRGLTFEDVPDPTYVSPEELSRRAAGFGQEYPEDAARQDEAVLAAVGAIERDADLRDVVSTALEEQVAGFYDPAAGELVVTGDPASGFTPEQELTLAHELEHALADQVLGLPVPERPEEGEEDAAGAALALVEGDATLTMTLYSLEGSFSSSLASSPNLVGLAGLTEIPYYVQRSFLFPYAEGTGFVCHLYSRGGWDAVNRAYAEPPTTTAQVLFPERYEAKEEAVRVRTVPRPPERLTRYEGNDEAWSLAAVRAWGAADLLFLFEAPGDDPRRALDDPLAQVSAWAGGEVRLWEKEGLEATSIALVERSGSSSLCDSMQAWYRAAFPDDREARTQYGEALATRNADRNASLRCRGNEVRLGIAPDLRTARDLAA